MTQLNSDDHFAHAVNISIEGLKNLLLINGGGATALIALSEKGSQKDFSLAIIFFGIGALFAVLSFSSAYCSQLSYANSRFSAEHGNHTKSDRFWNNHKTFQWVTFAFVLASVAFTCLAMYSAWHVASQKTSGCVSANATVVEQVPHRAEHESLIENPKPIKASNSTKSSGNRP